MRKVFLALLLWSASAFAQSAQTFYFQNATTGSDGTLTTTSQASATTTTKWIFNGNNDIPPQDYGMIWGSTCGTAGTGNCAQTTDVTSNGAWVSSSTWGGSFAAGTWSFSVAISAFNSAGTGTSTGSPCIGLYTATNQSGTGTTQLMAYTCAGTQSWTTTSLTTKTFTWSASLGQINIPSGGYLYATENFHLTAVTSASCGTSCANFNVTVDSGPSITTPAWYSLPAAGNTPTFIEHDYRQVSLTCGGAPSGATSCNLYRNGVLSQSGIGCTGTFQDPTSQTLSDCTSYNFTCSGVNGISEGAQGGTLTTSTGPAQPTSFSCTATGMQIGCSWAPVGCAALSPVYNIYKNSILRTSQGGTSYTEDNPGQCNTSYTYQTAATCSTCGGSPLTSGQVVTTMNCARPMMGVGP